VKAVFVCYAILHFTLTHWPNLQVPGPLVRTDLVAHLTFFATWTILLTVAGFFGSVLSTRNLGLCWLCGLANGLLDEALQGIPIVSRHCAWDDATANMAGATTAILVFLTVAMVKWRRSQWRVGPLA